MLRSMSNPHRSQPVRTARSVRQDRPRPAPVRGSTIRTAAGIVVTLLSLLTGCASDPAKGPAFVAATEPPEGHASVFVFRVDPQHSLSTVDLALDERDAGRLRNHEYVRFDLTPGIHRLDFRQRGLAFASWGWNRQQLRVRAGETVYLEISVRMSAQPMPGPGQDVEIQGRTSGSASENVFIQRRPAVDALPILANTTLRVE